MEEINANEAYSRSRGTHRGVDDRDSDDINFTLTMNRLFEIIRNVSDEKQKFVAFPAPRFVMDGCLADPVKLAKQMKVHLIKLGYRVERHIAMLYISWGRDEPKPKTKPKPSRSSIISIGKKKHNLKKREYSPPRPSVKLKPTLGAPRGFANHQKKNTSVSIRRVPKPKLKSKP